MDEEYTVNDFIDADVAKVPNLDYIHSEFDDSGYSDLNGAITDETIDVGAEKLAEIQRTGEEIISDVNRQIQERIDQQEKEKAETGSDSDSDSTSATGE